MRKLLGERLFWQRPQTSELSGTCVDMHSHTRFSDGFSTVARIAKKAQKLDIGVSITDHNEIRGALELARYPDILTIPGIEVSAKEGIHLLIYFHNLEDLARYYEHFIKPYKIAKNFYILDTTTLYILQGARQFPCVISAAHPYGAGATGLCQALHNPGLASSIIEYLDAVEIFNGCVFKSHNEKALRFCQVSEFGLTGGSDAHSLQELGNTITHVDSDTKDASTFLNAITENKTTVIGKECNVVLRPYSKLRTLKNFTRHPIHYSRHATKMVTQRIQAHQDSGA